jgi:hypothetical protein
MLHQQGAPAWSFEYIKKLSVEVAIAGTEKIAVVWFQRRN